LGWYLSHWHLISVEQSDGLPDTTGPEQAAQVYFMDGVWLGKRLGYASLGSSPSTVDRLVEQSRVPQFPGCPRQLHQNRASISFGDELRGVAQPSHGSANVANLS
jgi:hypothetical protein